MTLVSLLEYKYANPRLALLDVFSVFMGIMADI